VRLRALSSRLNTNTLLARVVCLYVQLKEVQNTLELVQGQRNELRQEVKDLKAALAEAKDTLDVRTSCAGTAAACHVVTGWVSARFVLCVPCCLLGADLLPSFAKRVGLT
jgi:hypothetical protein